MTRADEDESSSDLWGDSRKYEELASHLLDTVPPSGQISPLTSAPKDVPPDGALRRHSEKLRTAEAHRRREYHELLSIPGDKSQDVEWAEDFVENLLKNIAPYGRGVMTAYAFIQGWRQLMYVSHFSDDHAPEWERTATNKPYLAWTRMEENLKSIVMPDYRLVELMRSELDRARTLTGTVGATIRASMPEGTSVARTLCLLVELEHLEATLERMIVRWRESDSAAERRERDKPGAERNAAEQGEAERKSQEHLSLGVLFYNERDWDAAIREYREALLLRPDNADTHNNLGDALQAKGDQQGAIREYREALRLRPQLYSEVQTALNSILEPLDRQIGSCDVVCGPVSFLVIPLGTFLWLWLGLRIHWWLALLWGGLAFLVGLVAWLSIVEPILLRRCGVRPFEERFPDASAERPIALSILAEMKPNTTSGRGMLQTHFKDRV